MEDVTFLIQGSLKEDTYKFYCRFYPNVKKIFSTWANNRFINKWRGDYSFHSESDLVLESEVPNRIGFWERRMELQLVSTLKGLNRASDKYLIKLRGDEWYSNLGAVLETIRKDNEGKLFMTPSFVKRWDVWPFRMNDHFVAGKTDDLRIMFESAVLNTVSAEELFEDCWPLPSQSILAMSYMHKKLGNCRDWKKHFKEMFAILPLNPLKLYKISSDDGRRVWYSNFKPDVESMNEI